MAEQLWDVAKRRGPGQPKAFQSAEELREKSLAYLHWAEENPLWEEKVFHHQGDITRTRVAKMRATTQYGLCVYLGISEETWRRYREDPQFCEVTREIDGMIRDQKFAGASAELLNPNIIARDLGLSEKQETNVSLNFSLDPHDKDA